MYLDSHVHFWQLDRGDYGWLRPENTVLYCDYLPVEWVQQTSSQAMEGCIVVQAASTVEETEYLLALSDRYDFIRGVVGWIDIEKPSFKGIYNRLRKHPRFVGIRLGQLEFAASQGDSCELIMEHLRLLEADGFAVDLLNRPDDMPAVLSCLRQVPGLRAVINHLGIPPMRTGAMKAWSSYIDRLAEFPNVYGKWSGMITQAGGVLPDTVLPYAAYMAERLGPDRLMFGSDWPVALQAGGYDDVIRLFESILPREWSDEQRANVRANNAMTFYDVDGRVR